MSLSEWIYSRDRVNVMDFVVVSKTNFILVLKPQPAEMDTGLFRRYIICSFSMKVLHLRAFFVHMYQALYLAIVVYHIACGIHLISCSSRLKKVPKRT